MVLKMAPRSANRDMEIVISADDGVSMWEILVPTSHNDGSPFTLRHHRQWDRFVQNISGGMTIVQPVAGRWIDPESGELYRERMIPVRIVCSDAQIEEICRETARHYDQIAVLATLIGTRTVMVRNPGASALTFEADAADALERNIP